MAKQQGFEFLQNLDADILLFQEKNALKTDGMKRPSSTTILIIFTTANLMAIAEYRFT